MSSNDNKKSGQSAAKQSNMSYATQKGASFASDVNKSIYASDLLGEYDKALGAMGENMSTESAAVAVNWEKVFSSIQKILDESSAEITKKFKELDENIGKIGDDTGKKIEKNWGTPFKNLGSSVGSIFKEGGLKPENLKKVSESISGAANSIFGAKGETTASISGMITALGGNGADVSRIMGGVNDTLTGTADVVSGIATMDPAKVIGGIAKAVTGIINIFGKDAGIEKKIKKIQKEIDELTKSSKELERQEKKLYGQQKSDKISEEIANVAKQKELVEQQKELEESKKKTDKKQVESYEKAITDLKYKLEDLKDQQIASVIGKDLSKMVDDFATAYVNAWTAGNDKAAAMKDVVKKSIQSAAMELIKSNMSGKVKEFTEKLAEAMEDGILTPYEEEALDRLQQQIYEKAKIDESFNKYFDPAKATRTAASQGITAMSQDTATDLNGRFTAIQAHTASIKDSVISLAKNGEEMLKTLFGIEQNTSRLAAIENNMVAMRNGIDYINMKGVRLI